MVNKPLGFPTRSHAKKTPENHICYISDNQQIRKFVSKKYVLKHKKWSKNLHSSQKGCNFALAFGNEQHEASENEKVWKKFDKKFGYVKKMS